MSLKQNLLNALKKNYNKQEAIRDISSFAALEGDDGERILEHLFKKFRVFDYARNKDLFQAGFDEGAKAVLVYIATMRSDYKEIKQKLEETNE